MLEVRDLHAFYGKSHVLHGVSLDVRDGEIVSLLGRNGVGRSTTVKAIMGQVRVQGDVRFRGESIAGLKPHEIARRGIGCVPEDRAVFPDLTVRENLELGRKKGSAKGKGFTFDDAFELFARLREREHTAAGVLSGGEQQMLALCRTLMGNPSLVLIDEPTEGLAPQVVEQVARFLETIRGRGVSILLVEQKLAIALEISERAYVLGHGRVVFEGTPAEILSAAAVRKEWLEV
ncbi:MAG TPA: ABC transporter ATP-binding protein [Usitatibacter sp.]|jgi:branched-chain amino acid transport system ATP-binding protein|nr:ABC transporter ATP-binding protein [Usitatibacter sp.]